MLFDGRVYLQYTFTGNSTTKTSIWRHGKSASGKFRKIHINRGIWVGKHPFGQFLKYCHLETFLVLLTCYCVLEHKEILESRKRPNGCFSSAIVW